MRDSWIGWVTVWLILGSVIVLFGLMGCDRSAPPKLIFEDVVGLRDDGHFEVEVWPIKRDTFAWLKEFSQ